MPTKKNTRAQKTKQIPEQDSIKEFYRKILLLQEEERRRISRDLHDETGQMVIALGASLNVLERAVSDGFKDRALNVITDNRKLIQEIATKMKSMALNLRPPTLDILGLSAVLREYFSQCTKSNPVKITFNENIKDIKLDENVEITLYRIIQEAMFNVFKHSKAGAVKVDLFMTKDKLQLSIEDNGVGFNVKDLNTMGFAKMGLRGIQERVAILKGAFNIESYEGKGTKLIIILEKEGLANAD